MKKMSKQNITLLALIAVVAIAAPLGFYLLKKNRTAESLDEVAPGQGPSEEDEQYVVERKEKCPIWAMESIVISDVVEITDYDCDFLESGEDTGEDVTVEIYSADKETGKQEFLSWLSDNGLEIGDNLRVTYVHNPR